ncbi:hypothetical protein AMS68_000505 [Peltaster fructicola]|uniref:J domain-containing protein n=1 Tax=Peltaster fructicola TaxID=286661 RepID=A0A6H0XK30_9PEZI|nr:hypothetical protein AMS68_000505 [Peltaster fructicola]
MSAEEIDLYEVLSISKGATKVEIKKAYHKAALSSHPDKVQPEQREEAEIKFKAVSQAYEILSDDQTRALYDQHGMAAFDKGAGGMPGQGPDLDDMLAQMFGMGGGFPGGAPRPGRRRQKGASEQQAYEVTLEDLYKGKSTKFASTKKVICSQCSGSGGKEKAKPKECGTCKGRGMQTRLRPVGPGLVTQETVACSTCNGLGKFYADKDKCKKCKGVRTVQQKSILELYIPPGSREGDKIVLAGEADQSPDEEEPGDIIFQLVEAPHETFNRAGADLQAEITISLAEALTGFNRLVLTHLDGRGISLNIQQPNGQVIRPGQILKVAGEGMPIKRSDARGNLYLIVDVEFPADGWLKTDNDLSRVRDILPKSIPTTKGEASSSLVDEVEFETVEDMEDFGRGSGDPRAQDDWEDDEDDAPGGAQCQQQ